MCVDAVGFGAISFVTFFVVLYYVNIMIQTYDTQLWVVCYANAIQIRASLAHLKRMLHLPL